MDKADAWNKFYVSGNVEDYLKYVSSARVEAKELEQNVERNSDTGNGIQRK